MNTPEIWITPLALLPGVALLILSTSTRFGHLHSEIHHLRHEKQPIPDHLIKRARYFNNALSLLYASVIFFALGALFGGFSTLSVDTFYWVVIILLCFGILAIVAASFYLFNESRTAFKIIEEHIHSGNN